MNTPPELLPFTNLEYDDECCDSCRRSNKIIKQTREEVQRLQCDSPYGGMSVEDMKLQIVINITPKINPTVEDGDVNITVALGEGIQPDVPSKRKADVMANAINQLSGSALKLWSTIFTDNAAVERIAQMMDDLFSEDEPDAERPSHLN